VGQHLSCDLCEHKDQPKDFGPTSNAALETGGILVGDEVTVTVDVEFVKA
jgi:hypothetical protein